MDYHCYYCGIVKQLEEPVSEYEFAASDSGHGENSRPTYKRAGGDFRHLWPAGAMYPPAVAATKLAPLFAEDISLEFVRKVNTAVRGQHLNQYPIERALETGHGGRSLATALYLLFQRRGGLQAEPDFRKPCLSNEVAVPGSY